MTHKDIPHKLNPCTCGGEPRPIIGSGTSRHPLGGLWFRGYVKCKSCRKKSAYSRSPRKMADAWNRIDKAEADELPAKEA